MVFRAPICDRRGFPEVKDLTSPQRVLPGMTGILDAPCQDPGAGKGNRKFDLTLAGTWSKRARGTDAVTCSHPAPVESGKCF